MNLALVVAFFTLFSGVTFAQELAGGAKAGLVGGFSVPDSENTKPRNLWGFTGSAMISNKWSVGGYYLHSNKAESGGGREFEYSIHGLMLNYHIRAGKGDTFYGVRTGLSKVTTSESGNTIIFSPYHWGFAAGYDYVILPWFTTGFEGSYLQYDKSETRVSGTPYTEDKFNTISFVVSLKFIF